jgi:hypothetical protein
VTARTGRLAALAALVLVGLLAGRPRLAAASPLIEVIDHGAAVEVIARGVTAKRPRLGSLRQRLEVPLVGASTLARTTPKGDATVLFAEIIPGTPRKLSVKLQLNFADTRAWAPHARVEQVGPDLRMMIPRRLPTPGTAADLPPWTPTPVAEAPDEPIVDEPAAAVAAMPTTIDASSAGSGSGSAAAPDPEQGSTEAAAAGAPVAGPLTLADRGSAAPTAAVEAPARPTEVRGVGGAGGGSDHGLPLQLVAMIGLAGVAVVAWLLRRRRAKVAFGPSIDVVAQRAIGKVQVVWLAAGEREMVVGVAAQQVRILSQWRRPGGGATATTRVDSADPLAPYLPAPASATEAASEALRPTSPAVSGILRLRARGSNPAVPAPVRAASSDLGGDAETDADDAIWARELLAATRAPRVLPPRNR